MTTKLDFRSSMKKWLQEKGLTASPEELEMYTKDLETKYNSAVEESNKSNNTPRESTAPTSQANTREGYAIQNEGARDRYNMVTKPHGDNLIDWRGQKINQDTAALRERADSNTQQTLAIMGGSIRDLQGDLLNSKHRTHDKEIGYMSGRDDKLLGADEQYRQQQMTSMHRWRRLVWRRAVQRVVGEDH